MQAFFMKNAISLDRERLVWYTYGSFEGLPIICKGDAYALDGCDL